MANFPLQHPLVIVPFDGLHTNSSSLFSHQNNIDEMPPESALCWSVMNTASITIIVLEVESHGPDNGGDHVFLQPISQFARNRLGLTNRH